jgi:hypothetical protein
VPAGFDMGGIELVVAVVDPAGAEGQLFREILIVFVTEAVGADEGAGFGVANVSVGLSNGQENGGGKGEITAFGACREISMIQSHQLKMGTHQASLRPTRRALRRVRIMVDMVVRCGQWPVIARGRASVV